MLRDPKRLEALRRYEMLDTPPEEAFDEIVRLAAQICEAPVAAITFVDEKRVWSKSLIGASVQQVDIEHAISPEVLATTGLLVIPDMLEDPRAATSAARRLGARFFAGAGLRSPEGHGLGALCVFDERPRGLSPAQRQSLQALAKQVMIHLELRRTLAVQRESMNQLRAAQQELSDFVENANVGLHWVGPDGTITWANQHELDLLGYRREEYIGQHISRFHVDQPVIEDILARLGRNEELRDVPARLRAKDGSIRTVLINSTVRWKDGRFVHTRCFTRDVTDQQRISEALRQQQQQFEALVRNAPDIIVRVDRQFRHLYVNPAVEPATGMKPEQFLGRTNRELGMPAELCDMWESRWREVFTSGREASFEFAYPAPDGTRHYHARLVPEFAGDGSVQSVLGITRDVTQQHRDREHLDLYRSIFAHSNDGIAVIGPDGKYTEQNTAHWNLTGFSDEDLAGQTPAIHLGEQRFNEIAQVLAKEGNWRGEVISHTRRGDDLPVELSAFAVKGADGKPVCFVGIKRDISERVRAQEALREEAEVVETLRSVGMAMAAELDPQKLIQTITDAATQITRAQFGAFFHNIINPRGESYMLYALSGAPREAFEPFPMPRNTALFGPTFRGEAIVRSDDITKDPRYGQSAPHFGMPRGHLPVRSYLAAPVRSRSGDVLGGIFLGHPEVGVFTEREERLLAGIAGQAAVAIDNARLYEAEQRARAHAEAASNAKDQFLAVLSHELRTPLTPVLTSVQLLEMEPDLPAELRPTITMIRRNVELEARLIDDLLDLTRISRGKIELHFSTVDVHDKLKHVKEICRADIDSKQLELELNLAAEQPFAQADPARLQQVLWNLLKNAVKFTPVGGRITVVTRNCNRRLIVQVKDTGIGIEKEMLPRIFNAFEQGGREVTRLFGGLGLGLTISKALVDLHGGSLGVQSDGRDRGSTFTLELPVSQKPKLPAAPKRRRQINHAGTRGRILLVEDHADTAQVMARLLERQGYGVQTATTVAAALKAAQSQRFDLLISDIGLPDGSGLDLMRRLLEHHPVKGIALSGFGMEEDIRRSRDAGFAEHLTKPVNLTHLQSLIEKMIEKKPA